MLRPTLAVLAGALALCATLPAHAVGQLIDVQVVDRTTGETLKPIFHKGEWWIAGRPGARYGVTLLDRNGQRTLNVVSIDGVNAITGDTAAWSQSGYVIDAYESTRIDGWRKNLNQVAAFEFTALPDSYAARTGRPANVGVIGVATFTERPRFIPQARTSVAPTAAESSVPTPSAGSAPLTDAEPAQATLRAMRPEDEATYNAINRFAQRERLGTGHGAIEESSIRYVDFRRAQVTPNEIVTIHYDRTENLIAMGILPHPIATGPSIDPFPNSGRFVADPPPRR